VNENEPDAPQELWPEPERSPSERLTGWARDRREERRAAREAAEQEASHLQPGGGLTADSASPEPVPKHDRLAFALALVSLGGIAASVAVDYGFSDGWPDLLRNAAGAVGWPLAGLVVTLAVGRRWSGVWALWLIWAVPMTTHGVAGAVGTAFDVHAFGLMALADLAFGALLLYAAWRQDRAWSATLARFPRGDGIRGEPSEVVQGGARAVLIGALGVLLAIALVEGYTQSLGSAPGSFRDTELMYSLLNGSSRYILLVAVVAVMAYHARLNARAAFWVFAVAGTFFLATAVTGALSLLSVGRDSLGGFFYASVFSTLVELAWSVTTVTVAVRMFRVLDRSGDTSHTR
jgi:hypothetical protein